MAAGTDATDVLLIGGGVAAVRCARTLRKVGFEGRIVLVGDERTAPYNRPPLSKELLRDDLPDDLVLAEQAAWYERREVELMTGRTVVELDLDASAVTLDDGARLSFARCLLATGAAPRSLAVSGGDRCLLLRSLDDARQLRQAATTAVRGAPVVVVGGGFIGLEVASSLASLGLRPTLVELSGTLWSGSLGTLLSDWALERLEAAGVGVRLAAAATRIDAGAAWIGDERLEAAFVVAGIGVRPREELAARAGLGVADGILTDAGHRTSHPAVWAAGDVARRIGRRIEHWHAAREGGERAARSMLGLEIGPDPPPWVFSEVASHAVDVIGAVDPWGEERWVRDGVLAYVDGARLVGLAIIDSAMPVEGARELVAEGDASAVPRGAVRS